MVCYPPVLWLPRLIFRDKCTRLYESVSCTAVMRRFECSFMIKLLFFLSIMCTCTDHVVHCTGDCNIACNVLEIHMVVNSDYE